MGRLRMDANIAIAQARGLRRVAADLDRVLDDYLKGDRIPADDNDARFPAEEFLGSMLAAPVVRALAAELALKAISIKTTGDHKRGHDLLKLFDALDQKTQLAIEQKRQGVVERIVRGSVRSILAKHKDDFTASRYVGELPPDSKPTFAYGVDLDVALQDLIAVFEELPTTAREARSASGRTQVDRRRDGPLAG
ncbi:MAG: HEPN domain-containing protein [Gammaproteobacteria bacterium]|nr:HEPN domain-containing protein [Gammaproteobacteria bacterium]